MFFDFLDEAYTDHMVREAIRNPSGSTPIPGLIWSSNVSNFVIIHHSLRSKWTYTDQDGSTINVEAHAQKLNKTSGVNYQNSLYAAYINALSDSTYQSDKISTDIKAKIESFIYVNGPATKQYTETIDHAENFLPSSDTIMCLFTSGLALYGALISYYNNDSE